MSTDVGIETLAERDDLDHEQYLAVISTVASAYASRETSTVSEILMLIDGLYKVFGAKSAGDHESSEKVRSLLTPSDQDLPAVPIQRAVQNDKVVCLCCGSPFTMLKRHLRAEHGLTEDQYRKKFSLPEDFPLVAPSYSERKAAHAREAGLGKHRRDAGVQSGS